MKLFVFLVIAGLLVACGEVKVVDDPSLISKVNPANEIIAVSNQTDAVAEITCLQISEPTADGDIILSAIDADIFKKAAKAHLAPLNYPVVNQKCPHKLLLQVNEFRVRDFVVASRLVIDVNARIDSEKGQNLWAASYRMTENAGGLPLDPISAGFGVASAAQNSGQENIHNGIYLTVRRLFKALPDHSGFSTAILEVDDKAHPPKEISAPTYTDAMNLWERDERKKAIEIVKILYDSDISKALGYQYGLMLEAVERDSDAAIIYSETAVALSQNADLEGALRALRRLDRLNSSKNGRFDLELDKALVTVRALVKTEN